MEGALTGASMAAAALFSLCLFAGVWVFLRRRPRLPRFGILLVLAGGALLRLYLMQKHPGYQVDMNCFYSWGLRMAENGPAGFYAPDYFCDYPPGYLWLLWLPGKLIETFGLDLASAGGRLAVKLVPFLFDLAAILLIWKTAQKALDGTDALALAGLYALSPAVLMDSAIWGQADAVVSFGLALALIFAMKGRWQLALPVYLLAVLVKPQALLAGPLGLAALCVDIASGREKRCRVLKRAAAGLGAGAVLGLAVLLPFLQGEASPLAWLLDKYFSTMTHYSYASVNALNLHYLLGGNWMPLEGGYGAAGMALTALVALFPCALYLCKRDARQLPLLGALTFILIYLLGAGMHERYLFPAFLLLLLAYTQRQDWRILALFCGFGLLFFINCALLLRSTHLPLGLWAPGIALSLLYLALGAAAVWVALDSRTRRVPGVLKRQKSQPEKEPCAVTPKLEHRPLHLLLLALLTLAYGAVAFYDLGSRTAPQTVWRAQVDGTQLVFDTHSLEPYDVLLYHEITRAEVAYTLETSQDGETYSAPLVLTAGPGNCFQWQYVCQNVQGRYLRLSAQAGLSLGEVVLRGTDGGLLPVTLDSGDAGALLDESGTAPGTPSYRNSAYFDEIYHARTAYEHLHGMVPYETTHPPLGKIFIMLGIQLFGMTPFGWRFSGTVAGILMIPAMYALGLVVFRRGRWGLLAAFLMAVDTLHFTMTRIATIDSYPVLFIILAYAAMFRFAQMSPCRDGWKILLPLGLSGLFTGLAIACKWIGFYAAAGLALIFFYTLYQGFGQSRLLPGQASAFKRYAAGQVLFCVAAFGLLPLGIYYLSYLPHLAPLGGLTPGRFWQAQTSMLDYHANLQSTHSFSSPWYEWPLSLKPLYLYTDSYPAPGQVSAINAFGSLVVWWGGFACLCALLWTWYAPHAGLKAPRALQDGTLGPGYILLGFAAQFLPWMLVSRLTFIYHYFASLVFVILAIVYIFAWLAQKSPKACRLAVCVYGAAALGLFLLHYPLASGMAVSRAYADGVNFLQGLKLPGWLHY